MTFNFANDLSCYSLSKNSNVPTSVFDMNHYYTYRQQQQQQQQQQVGQQVPQLAAQVSGGQTPAAATQLIASGSNMLASSSSTSNEFPMHSSNSASFSKLDLLIQTATSVDLDSMLEQSSSNSKRSFGAETKELGLLKKQKKFDIDHLCSQAEKLHQMEQQQEKEQSNRNYNDWMSKKAIKSKIVDTNNEKPLKRTSSNDLEKDIKKPATTQASSIVQNLPTSIKLASPSSNTKRQRSGPSCDCCRSRKIKCDSEIFIMSDISIDEITASNDYITDQNDCNSFIAHCEFVSLNTKTGYQFYKIFKDKEKESNNNSNNTTNNNNKLTSFTYLQFKPCSACTTKNLKCCFSKGFTRNDIIRFNKHERQNQKSNTNNNSNSSSNSISTSPTPLNPTPLRNSSPSNVSSSSKTLNNPVDQNSLRASLLKLENDTSNSSSKSINISLKKSSSASESNNTNTTPVERKSNKKTSCKTCRSKKIKCVKTEGSSICVHCIKKSQGCVFE